MHYFLCERQLWVVERCDLSNCTCIIISYACKDTNGPYFYVPIQCAMQFQYEQNITEEWVYDTQFVLFFTISEASHFSYPGNIIGIFPLQISQSTVSDIPDNWLQVKRLLLSTKKWANETDKMPIDGRVGARKLNTNTTNVSF